jgi:HK97 family phage portal protein
VNPLRALGRKSPGSTLGSLIAAYLRDGGDAQKATTEDGAMRVSAVMSCVRLIAETVGSLPLHAFTRLDSGGKQRVAPTNSLEALLQKPNDYQTPLEFREQLTAHMLLRGNGYAYIDWQTTLVDRRVLLQAKALHPLPVDQVEVKIEDTANRAREVRYLLHRSNGEPVPLPADEVLHLKGLTSDGINGRSVLMDAQETIAGALSTQRYANRLFDNDATPGVILEHPSTLTDDVARRIAETFDARHAGSHNSRKTAVLEEGMKANRLSIAPNDAQFLETRQFQRAEIAGLFRVPPHLIGDVDRSTSWGTGIEQQQIAFLVYTIRPWLVRWEQGIKRSLILREDTMFVEHLVEGLLRGDIASRYGAYVQGINNSILTPNEVRGFENVNPSTDPNADKLFRQANVVPIDTPVNATAGAQV